MDQQAIDCSAVAGNADLYGLGVRIGVYAQWTATLLTTVFDASNESALGLLNLVVQTAMFVGLCTESARGANAVGSVITQFLLCGSLSSVTGDGISHLGHVSGLMRSIFYTGLSAYAIWFWFTGVDGMLGSSCRQVVFFGPSLMTGWFRSMARILSIAGLVVCLCLTLSSILICLRRFRRGLTAAFVGPPRRRPQVELSLMLLSVFLLGLSVATVEYLIRENNVQDVGAAAIGSVAQLIPLLAGGLACVLSVWKIVTHGLVFRKRCWLIFGWHL
ncbi:hypothetical protein CDD81_1828 [Ophiocordyceps australis]|uniref:Uncharacterized protein n=1 Tax=Ophiocordyceps australis TaxID=1399860 RepID=A0A2C5XY72_9HYPO|nr:hypothetical protein CDD81_1828 [Ophiocordyceps australis]